MNLGPGDISIRIYEFSLITDRTKPPVAEKTVCFDGTADVVSDVANRAKNADIRIVDTSSRKTNHTDEAGQPQYCLVVRREFTNTLLDTMNLYDMCPYRAVLIAGGEEIDLYEDSSPYESDLPEEAQPGERIESELVFHLRATAGVAGRQTIPPGDIVIQIYKDEIEGDQGEPVPVDLFLEETVPFTGLADVPGP